MRVILLNKKMKKRRITAPGNKICLQEMLKRFKKSFKSKKFKCKKFNLNSNQECNNIKQQWQQSNNNDICFYFNFKNYLFHHLKYFYFSISEKSEAKKIHY